MTPGYPTVSASIYIDRTGSSIGLPILVSAEGPVMPLLRYQILNHANSNSWHVKLLQAVRLLLLYAAANPDSYEKPRDLFAGFSNRIMMGTIGEDGLDPSGLYWVPRRSSDARRIIRMLTEFSAWLAAEFGVPELNPLRDATRHEQVLAAAAWAHRNEASFLGHLGSRSAAWRRFEKTHLIGLPHAPAVSSVNEAVRFPEEYFPRLLTQGFMGQRDIDSSYSWLALRNILITLLMHGAGFRCSECFHLWIEDVKPDPFDPSCALVQVGHPSEGLAEWRDAGGRPARGTRREYLLTCGLTPRHLVYGKGRAGWKHPALDGKYYIQAHWSDVAYGRLFFAIWKQYLSRILPIKRRHPWAFISATGDPYKMASFHEDYDRAMKSIGLLARRSEGGQPHCHRHAYGGRLGDAKVSPMTIRKAMHHGSLQSQEVYTQADQNRMHADLNAGRLNMAAPCLSEVSMALKLEDMS